MSWIDGLRTRLHLLVRRGAAERRMDEEIRFHMEMETAKNLRAGMTPDEARRRAAVTFGGVEKHREALREERGLAWLGGMSLDLRLGVRMLGKHPGLTLVGGVGMAVAIAIGAGFFAFLHSNLFPRLPLPDGDRIIALENWDLRVNNEARRQMHDLVTWRAEMRTVRDVAAFRDVSHNLIGGEGPPELITVAEMTASGFRVARVPPLLGRPLVEADEAPGAPAVVVIGEEVWRSRFGGDRAVVGRTLRLGKTPHTVVGVMPESFGFPMSHRYWTPLRVDPQRFPRGEGPEIHVFARLAPGRTLAHAQAELSAIGRRTAAAFPDTHGQVIPQALPYTRPLLDIQNPDGGSGWVVMQATMSLLLVVVALNVAVLVYARTATRRAEIAVRSALGASRRRIVAQLFAEALVLASLSAVAGLGLAHMALRLGYVIMETEIGVPFWTDYGLRAETVLYTVGLTLLAAAIVGVVPALQSTGRRLQGDLRQLGGGTGMRLGRTWTALIVVQIAIAVAVLPAVVATAWGEIGGALTRPTFPTDRLLVAGLAPGDETVPAGADTAAWRRDAAAHFGVRLGEVLRRVRADPAVAAVGYTARLPGMSGRVRLEVEGVPAPPDSPSGHDVRSMGGAPGFLEVLGTRLLTGRGFGPADAAEGADAVLVNRTFVRRVLGGGDAVGRRVRFVPPAESGREAPAPPARWLQVVGVVDDLQANPLDPDQVPPGIFYPVAVGAAANAALAVRLRSADAPDFAGRLREITTQVDATLVLSDVSTMAEMDRQGELALRLVGLALSAIMLSVFLLSAAGVYALMSFAVTQRRREIGIRSALGAPRRQVLRSIFSRAAWQLGLGLATGVVLATMLHRASAGAELAEKTAMLVPAFTALMAVVGLLAAVGPARRGLRIQPTEAMRAE